MHVEYSILKREGCFDFSEKSDEMHSLKSSDNHIEKMGVCSVLTFAPVASAFIFFYIWIWTYGNRDSQLPNTPAIYCLFLLNVILIKWTKIEFHPL